MMGDEPPLRRDERHETLAANASASTIAEVLLAFANSNGGRLTLGVDAASNIIGCPDPEASRESIVQAALLTLPPLMIPMPHIVAHEGQTLVVAQVPPGLPHVYAMPDGRYLHRRGGRCVPMPPNELHYLLQIRNNFNYEAQPVHTATRDDLDWDRAQAYTRQLTSSDEDTEALLLRRGCLARHDGRLVPTIAGLLCFGRQPQQFILGADVSAVRFAGPVMGDTFTRQDIVGNLPDQIRRLETFLRDNLRKTVSLTANMERQEEYEYPLEAARELVVNAVAHRDYSITGDNIHLFIFSDRLEVHSPGRLPGPITLATLRHERFSRNPIIVQILSDLRFIERLGYGVDRVWALMERARLQSPRFEERSSGFLVTLYNARQPKERPKASAAFSVALAPESSFLPGPLPELNLRQEAALARLREGKAQRLSNSDIAALFPDVVAETIRRDLADLVTRGLLLKMGQKRGSYYVLPESDEANAPRPLDDGLDEEDEG